MALTGARWIRVWDPAVRVLHWGLVATYAIAYLTEDDMLSIHRVAGYAVGAILALRVVWGFVGPRHARFADFVHRPRGVLGYLRDLVTFRSRRYLGHSPAGGAMVIALLAMLVLTVATGIAADQGGARSFLREAHDAIANLGFLLVLAHIGGVALASFVHRENLVRAMVTGLKPERPERTSTRM